MSKCQHCGGDILKPGNRSSYCTIECRNAAAAKRAREKRKSAVKVMKMTRCFKCEEEFEYRVWSSHLPPHFCPKCNRMRFGWGKS